MIKNTQNSYGWLSILMHWLSAVAVIGLFALGFWMVDLDYYSDWYQTGPHIHESVGILLAVMVVFRIVWKAINTNPHPVGTDLEKKAAHGVHGVLYLLMLLIFVSGYLITTADGRGIEVFNWFVVPSLGEFLNNQEDLAGEVHEIAAYILMGLVVLHAAAAFLHHFVHKDTTLVRMLKPTLTKEDL